MTNWLNSTVSPGIGLIVLFLDRRAVALLHLSATSGHHTSSLFIDIQMFTLILLSSNANLNI